LGDGKMGKSMDCNNQHLGFIMIYQELDRLGPAITGLVVSIMTFMTYDRLGMEKSSQLTNSNVSRWLFNHQADGKMMFFFGGFSGINGDFCCVVVEIG